MKKLISLVLAFLLLCASAACTSPQPSAPAPASPASAAPAASPGAPSSEAGKTTAFIAAHANPEAGSTQAWFVKFQELMRSKMEGRYDIEIYPNGALGQERDLIEGMKMGTVDLVNSNCSVVSNYVPEFYFNDIPFLYTSYDVVDKIMAEGTIPEYFRKGCEAAGFIMLGIGENGIRHMFYNGDPIQGVKDFHGQKIRTQENKMHLEFWKMLGVSPVSMNGSDALTAIQQGAIDGMEYPIALGQQQGLHEMAKNLTFTYHIYVMAPTLMRPQLFNAMSAEDQKLMYEMGEEASVYARSVQRKQEAEAIKIITDSGANIYHANIEEIKAKIGDFYSKYQGQYGDLLKVVESLQ